MFDLAEATCGKLYPRTFRNRGCDSNTQQDLRDSGICKSEKKKEPLSLSAAGEDGYRYPSAVVGHRLGQYKIVRKREVCVRLENSVQSLL